MSIEALNWAMHRRGGGARQRMEVLWLNRRAAAGLAQRGLFDGGER